MTACLILAAAGCENSDFTQSLSGFYVLNRLE
jgi:hypothetical protein